MSIGFKTMKYSTGMGKRILGTTPLPHVQAIRIGNKNF
jgi:hypothetical protein